MSVQCVRNIYAGINAHLHSLLQNGGGWDEFHTAHISDLMRLMRVQLLPMGYTAALEQSLQIRRAEKTIAKPESDVTVYDLQKRPATGQSLQAPLVLELPQLIAVEIEDALANYRAIRISTADERRQPVAWLELLSPSNKPGGQDAAYFRSKRLKLIQSGLVYVEVDYLHESAPTFDYLRPTTSAYRIVVIDPRPDYASGQAGVYGFGVGEPVPQVAIPLNADDRLHFAFGAAYGKTYTEAVYGLERVDYAQLPPRFERYSADDQAHIIGRMVAALSAAKQGKNLETAPLITPPDATREQLENLQNDLA